MSRHSRLSADFNGDNAIKPGSVHISPGIYLMTEENPIKPQLGDHLMKAVRPVIASNGVPYLQIWSVGLHSMSEREKEGKKKGTGVVEQN